MTWFVGSMPKIKVYEHLNFQNNSFWPTLTNVFDPLQKIGNLYVHLVNPTACRWLVYSDCRDCTLIVEIAVWLWRLQSDCRFAVWNEWNDRDFWREGQCLDFFKSCPQQWNDVTVVTNFKSAANSQLISFFQFSWIISFIHPIEGSKQQVWSAESRKQSWSGNAINLIFWLFLETMWAGLKWNWECSLLWDHGAQNTHL